MTGCLADLDIVVLAGGQGTRIAETLGDRPKVMALIDGKPFIDHLLARLRRFGAERVIFSLGHLAAPVTTHLQSLKGGPLTIEWIIEDSPQGTAGGVRMVRGLLRSEQTLVMNGDSLALADLCAMRQRHADESPEISVLCVRMDDTRRYGRVETGADGFICRFTEKGADEGPGLINAGVYLFSGPALSELCEGQGPSLERDFLQTRAPGAALTFDAGPVPFVDIGTPESLAAAAAILSGAA